MEFEKFISHIVQEVLNNMKDRNWTVYRLSEETGISAQTIHNWFAKGPQKSVPSLRNLLEACNAFGIPITKLFAENDLVEMTPELKGLYDGWCLLSKTERDSVKTIIDTYNASKKK